MPGVLFGVTLILVNYRRQAFPGIQHGNSHIKETERNVIGRLRGLILEKKPPVVLLEVGGVGYEVHMPMTCFYQLGETNKEAIIFTHFVVREDAQQLYGFTSHQARLLFRELIKVNGVGPKLALAILSGMSAQQFVQSVQHNDANALIKLPGVGKKTAERLLIEMRDRLEQHSDLLPQTIASVVTHVTADDAQSEACSALVALGYTPPQASRMINQVASVGASSETLIREALRSAL